MSLPFWYDDLDVFFYIPDHKFVTREQAYEDHGITPTEISTCKAWWNTNLPMDHFIPTIIPANDTDSSFNVCLENFIERLKQRAEGKMVPTPPELKLKPGIIILVKDSLEPYAFVCTFPGEEIPGTLRIIVADDNPKDAGTFISLGSKTYIPGEVIKRSPDHLYWDMTEQKYV